MRRGPAAPQVQAALRSIPGVTLIDSSRVKPPPPLEALAAVRTATVPEHG